REKANGKPRLLICDEHDSHITASWIAHYMKNNIIFMVLPPHSSHLTQPLDVGVFGVEGHKTDMAPEPNKVRETRVRNFVNNFFCSLTYCSRTNFERTCIFTYEYRDE